MRAAFGQRKSAAADFFDTSPTTIDNWLDPTKAMKNIHHLLVHLGKVDLEIEDLDSVEDSWSDILHATQTRVANMSGHGTLGLIQGGQLQVLEENSKSGGQIILITDDAYNDTRLRDVYKMVEENLGRGVNYLYVVPSTCPNLAVLKEEVARSRKRIAVIPDAGSVHILCVKRDDNELEWGLIDHVLMTLSQVISPRKGVFDGLSFGDVENCFEQVYKPDEVPENHRFWLRTPPRKQQTFVKLLRRWEQDAEWL